MRQLLQTRMINNDKVILTLSEYDAIANAIKQQAIEQYNNDFQEKLSNLKPKEKATCPTCRKNSGTTLKTIVVGHVLFLAELLKRRLNTGVRFHHYDDIKRFIQNKFGYNTTDYSKLEFFKLIAKDDNNKSDGNSRGMFAIKNRGVKFLQNEVGIPNFVEISSGGIIVSESEEKIFLRDIWKNFNYNELLEHENVNIPKKKRKKILKTT